MEIIKEMEPLVYKNRSLIVASYHKEGNGYSQALR